jgi:hypothetical protein
MYLRVKKSPEKDIQKMSFFLKGEKTSSQIQQDFQATVDTKKAKKILL